MPTPLVRFLQDLAGKARVSASALILGAILAVTLALLAGIEGKAYADRRAAQAAYRQESSAATARAADAITARLMQIHQGLRTISLLPSVRRIERHGENIDADALQSIQQLYNNLRSNVAISEVYIVPADLNPERVDPHTGELEEPILMFDELIVNAAKRASEAGLIEEEEAEEDEVREVEIYEYRALRDQMTWLRAHFPTDEQFGDELGRPMLSTPEVITCDNTTFVHTRDDADRSGILLSVPFYGPDGGLKGAISAIVLTRALRGYLPAENNVLINTSQRYQAMSMQPGVAQSHAKDVGGARPGRGLIYSEVTRLNVPDAQGEWLLWAGRPNEAFWRSDAARGIAAFELTANLLLALFSLLAVGGLVAVRRQLRLEQEAKRNLEEAADAKAHKIEALERAKTEIEASEMRVRHIAYHDALTGLPNRSLLAERLAHAHGLSRRGQPFAVHCIDLDQFKGVNDTFGHQTGDELIRVAATKLASVCRRTDTLARLGGDEFAVVQLGATPASAATMASRLVGLMSEPMELSVGHVHVGCSVGVTFVREAMSDPQESLRQADLALYRAKESGRGQYAFFEPEMDAAVRTRRALQTDLKIALAQNALELHYQPQVDGAGRVTGVEALLRWKHKERGMVPPGLFVPIAEECGLIVDLGLFTLRRAFEDSARWPHMKVAINVSAHQIRMKNFVGEVARLVRETKVSPKQFELELTEGVLMGDDPVTHATPQGLRNMGFTLALDDFGTGYSSLSYLRRFPVQKIKIDRSFITNLGVDTEANAVVAAIVKLAGALGLSVIAEGVETREQREALSIVGCSQVQGYLTGKPMQANDIDTVLGAQRRQGRPQTADL